MRGYLVDTLVQPLSHLDVLILWAGQTASIRSSALGGRSVVATRPGPAGQAHRHRFRFSALTAHAQTEIAPERAPLDLEKDHRVDGATAELLVAVLHQIADEREVKLGFPLVVEVIRGYEDIAPGRREELEMLGARARLTSANSVAHHPVAP